jgi:hypothetical protein
MDGMKRPYGAGVRLGSLGVWVARPSAAGCEYKNTNCRLLPMFHRMLASALAAILGQLSTASYREASRLALRVSH